MESYQPKDIKPFKYCETFFKKALVVLEQYIEAGAYIPLTYKLRSKVVHGSKVTDAEIWKCRIVKTYLSDSIKQFARLSRKYKHKQVLNKIDKCIKSGETLGTP